MIVIGRILFYSGRKQKCCVVNILCIANGLKKDKDTEDGGGFDSGIRREQIFLATVYPH